MTTTEVRVAGDAPIASDAACDAVPERRRHHRRTALILLLVVVLATGLGYLVGNEVQANTQFDQAHRSLDLTRGRIHGVDAHLAAVQRQLAGLRGQVTQDSATLATDTATLNGVKAALERSQATVGRQNAASGSLHTCLGGVEEALNALSLGDQKHALAALGAVAPSCRAAESADG